MPRGPQRLTADQQHRLERIRALTIARQVLEQSWAAEIRAARAGRTPLRTVAEAADVGMTTVHRICTETSQE